MITERPGRSLRGRASWQRPAQAAGLLAGGWQGRIGRRIKWLAAGALLLLPGTPCWGEEEIHGDEIPLHGRTEESLREVARQVNNPIGPLWQLTFDNEIVGMDGGGLDGVEPAFTGSLQAQGPVWLGRPGWAAELGIFTRLTVPFIETVPVSLASGGDDRESGFGDIQLGGVLAPQRRSGFVWGIGPTFIFPSASNDALGQGKWQAGPAALAGYVGRSWTAYVIAEQWWSFAGDRDRSSTSQLCLEYVLIRNLPRRWQVGMQPSLTVDWKASADDEVSFPIGLGVGRTVRIGGLPVQFWLEADYYAVRPGDLSGPRWGVDLQITPVIAELF